MILFIDFVFIFRNLDRPWGANTYTQGKYYVATTNSPSIQNGINAYKAFPLFFIILFILPGKRNNFQ